MELYQYRYHHGQDHTSSLLKTADAFLCYILEDEYRKEKVKGETRIPAGRYQICKRTEITPLTRHYRQKFPWFDYHLELQEVPNFNRIYLHIGNYESNTDGCLLVGNGVYFDPNKAIASLTHSKVCYERIYRYISKKMEQENVFITIQNLVI